MQGYALAVAVGFAVAGAIGAGCAHVEKVAAPRSEEDRTIDLSARRAGELLVRLRATPRLRTMSGDAKAFVDAPENGGRYPLFFAVQAPASLRLDALTPLGDPAVVLIAHDGQLGLYDTRAATFYRGDASARNLGRLIPASLDASELVTLFTGGVPELAGALPVALLEEADGRWLVTSTVPPGTVTLRGARQRVRLGAGDDLRVLEFERVLAGGPRDGEVTLHVVLDDFDGPVARRLHIEVPGRKIKIDLVLKKVIVDHPPPPSAFGLQPPPGVRVEDLD